MSPGEIFDPSLALDPSRFAGADGAARQLDAAQHFPGGPAMLVFALFWSPVGPGIPAGVLLARHVPLNPLVTFGLYAVSDLLGAIVCHPIFTALRRHGRRVPTLHAFGRRFLQFATWGVRLPEVKGNADGSPRLAPALLRIGTIGFGVDVYTAGMVATGIAIPRIPGWASAIVGDLVWFALLLGSSLAAASVLNDDRFVALVVIVAMIAIPRIARRLFPTLFA